MKSKPNKALKDLFKNKKAEENAIILATDLLKHLQKTKEELKYDRKVNNLLYVYEKIETNRIIKIDQFMNNT